MGLFHGAVQPGTGTALSGLTRGYRAGTPRGSELDRGGQAPAGETGVGWGWRGHLGALYANTGIRPLGAPAVLGWEVTQKQALVVQSVLGEPWAGPCVSAGEPSGTVPCPDKELEQSMRRSELTVGVWTAPLRERGQVSSGTTGHCPVPHCQSRARGGSRGQPRAKIIRHIRGDEVRGRARNVSRGGQDQVQGQQPGSATV